MKGIHGNGCWQCVPGWNVTWVESLMVVPSSGLNLSELLDKAWSGVSDESGELVYLDVYKVIHNLVQHDEVDFSPCRQCFLDSLRTWHLSGLYLIPHLSPCLIVNYYRNTYCIKMVYIALEPVKRTCFLLLETV